MGKTQRLLVATDRSMMIREITPIVLKSIRKTQIYSVGKFRVLNVKAADANCRAVKGPPAGIAGRNPTGAWTSVSCDCCIFHVEVSATG
jgi:hypothetical protein